MTNEFKSWVTNPLFEVVFWTSKVVINNYYLRVFDVKGIVSVTCGTRLNNVHINGIVMKEKTSFFSFSISLSTRWEPMNPAPPVTRIRIFD